MKHINFCCKKVFYHGASCTSNQNDSYVQYFFNSPNLLIQVFHYFIVRLLREPHARVIVVESYFRFHKCKSEMKSVV